MNPASRARGRTFDLRLTFVVSIVVAMAMSTMAVATAITTGLASDDFSGGVGSVWSVVDPLGDGTVTASGGGTSDAVVNLSVPAGVSHDPWGTNRSLRLMQPVADGDFEVELKFDSLPSAKYQGQGLMVEQDVDDWMRFDVYSDGANVWAFSASTSGGSSNARLASKIQVSGSVWLRVARAGDEFTYSWSDDGQSFAQVGSFTHSIAATSVGPFVSNHNPSPAFTAVVDYVFDTAAPIDPEDPTGPDTTPPVVSDVAVSATDSTATVTWTTDEPSTSTVDFGTTSAHGATESVSGTSVDHEVVLSGLAADTVYHYVVTSVDAAGNVTTSSDATFTTDAQPPATYTLTTSTVGQGTVTTDPAGPDHPEGTQVTVSAMPDAGWVFDGWSGDVTSTDNPVLVTMNADTTITATFTQQPTGDPGLASDDFSGGVGSVWSVVDPLGDGTVTASGGGTSDAVVNLSVPAGVSHDPWGTNRSLRLMQPVADGDFEVELKFDSLPSAKYQGQGLMVEQDVDDWMRFDVYSDGANVWAFSASTSGGSSNARLASKIQVSGSVWLRVARAGDEFTYSWSDDGQSFAQVGSFTHSIAATSVGPFVSNHNPSPAFTAVVDYVFDTAAPIDPEDPTGPDTTPPVVSDVAVSATDSTATVTWTTDEPSTSTVDFGTTSAHGATESVSGTSVDHEVVLSGLAADTVYHYVVTSVDAAGNVTTSSDATFTTDAQPPATYTLTTSTVGQGTVTTDPAGPDHPEGTQVTVSAMPDAGWVFDGWSGDVTSTDNPVLVTMNADTTITATFTQQPTGDPGLASDDFSGGVGSVWSVVDPLGDGTVTASGGGTSDAVVNLSVPAGVSHDPWGTNRSLRLMQPVADGDFEVELKFDSLPSAKYQGQGLMVEQDVDDWMRFDVYSDGANVWAFSASTSGGSSNARLASKIQVSGSVWLRVARAGDEFTYSWSDDGQSFAQVGSFTHSIAATSVGPFVSNHNPSPAFTAVVDYVFDTAAPIDPEDPTGPDTTPPVVSDVAVSATDSTATVTWTTDEPSTSTVDFGTTSAHGATESVSGTSVDHEVVLSGLAADTVYHYVVTSVDAAGNVTTSSDATFTTDAQPPATYTLTTSTVGQGTVTTDPAGPDHPEGTQVTVSAMPDAGWVFDGWSGDVTSTDNPVLVTMNADTTITATITEDPSSDVIRIMPVGDSITRGVNTAPAGTESTYRAHLLRMLEAPGQQIDMVGPYNSHPTGTYEDQGQWDHDSFSYPGWKARTIRNGINDALTTHPADILLLMIGVNDLLAGSAPEVVADTVGQVIDVARQADPSIGIVMAEIPFASTIEAEIEQYNALLRQLALDRSTASSPLYTVDLNDGFDQNLHTFDSLHTNDLGEQFLAERWAEGLSDHFGLVADAGPVLDLWYGTEATVDVTGGSQRWVNVLGNVSDPDGVASLAYHLNGGPARQLSVGPDLRRLQSPGDFNVEIPRTEVVVGENRLVLVATGADGTVSQLGVTLTGVDEPTPALPFQADWGSVTAIGDLADVVDGKWSINNGTVSVDELGYDRLLALGDSAWTEYEVTMPLTVHGLGPDSGTPQSGAPLVGLGLRWPGHEPSAGMQPSVDFYPVGAYAWYRWQSGGRSELTGSGGSPISRNTAPLEFDTPYVMKARVEDVTDGTHYQYKMWPASDPEPDWQMQFTYPGGTASGGVLLIAHHVDVSISTVVIDPLP